MVNTHTEIPRSPIFLPCFTPSLEQHIVSHAQKKVDVELFRTHDWQKTKSG